MVLVLAAAIPGGAGQAVTSPARVTHSPTAPSLHGGMQGEWSSSCIPAGCCPGTGGCSSLAVSSGFLWAFTEGREQGGGCWIPVVSQDFAWEEQPVQTVPGLSLPGH